MTPLSAFSLSIHSYLLMCKDAYFITLKVPTTLTYNTLIKLSVDAVFPSLSTIKLAAAIPAEFKTMCNFP
jgi:hypothetical protein